MSNNDDETIFMNTTQNLLFICSKNRLRSPTAQIDGGLIEWADLIFVMEKDIIT